MKDDLQNALIIGIVGLIIMIAASIALWFFHASEVVCSIIMVFGLIVVIVAIIYASFPQYFKHFKKQDNQAPVETVTESEEPAQAENQDTIEEKPKE